MVNYRSCSSEGWNSNLYTNLLAEHLISGLNRYEPCMTYTVAKRVTCNGPPRSYEQFRPPIVRLAFRLILEMGHWPGGNPQGDWRNISNESPFVCRVPRAFVYPVYTLHHKFFYSTINRIEESIVGGAFKNTF
jgi:hypothetical protein